MDIAAVILNWNQAELTEVAALSVASDAAHVYLVDNGSRNDDLVRLRSLAQRQGMTLIENGRNLGYGAGNNPGIARALDDGHEALLLMNNDAWAEAGALDALVARLATAARVGAVQPMVLAETGEVLHTTCSLDTRRGGMSWDETGRSPTDVDTSARPTDWLSGEAFLARAEVFRQVGSFDERYFIYFEDVDWSLRARRAAWKLETVGTAVFGHAVTASMPSVGAAYHYARSRALFLRYGLGMSRLRAAALCVPIEARHLASFTRHGRFGQVGRGVVPGLASGLAS